MNWKTTITRLASGSITTLFLISCSPTINIPSPSATSRGIGTQAGTIEVLPAATVAIDPTVTNIPTATMPPATMGETIIPEIVKICPSEPEVELSELGVNPKFPLLLVPNDEDAWHGSRNIFVVSWVDASLTEFPIIPDLGDNWFNSRISVIPGGERLRYSVWNDDLVKETLWVSSLDGTEQYPVAEIWFAESYTWMTDKEIVIDGLHNKEIYKTDPREWYAQRMPLEVINISSGERKPLEALPEGAFNTNFFIIDEKYYAIYKLGQYSDTFLLYDYSTRSSIPIVKWVLGTFEPGNLGGPVFSISNGLIDIIRDRPSYGNDIALGLDLEILEKDVGYDQVMSKLVLPGEFEDRISSMYSDSDVDGQYLVFNYGYGDGIDLSPIYFFDSSRQVLKDYCLTKDERVSGPLHDVSPDGQFVAFSFFKNGYSETPKEVIILDLNTGYFARIEGLKVVGWGVQSEN